jgi:hypothetical protein
MNKTKKQNRKNKKESKIKYIEMKNNGEYGGDASLRQFVELRHSFV